MDSGRPPGRTSPLRALLDLAPELPGYDLEAVLGQGGMGLVVKGSHRELGRAVAIKIYRPEGRVPTSLDVPDSAVRLVEEARLVAKVTHRNVVRVYDVGILRGGVYVVLELLDGSNLRQHLSPVGRLGITQAVIVAEQIAGGLAALHAAGIIHRDLKPSNVMMCSRGAVVTDLGLARDVTAPRLVTATGIILGTPDYMAPEQAVDDPHLTGAVDVFALGVILFELVTGRLPFEGTGALAVLRARLDGKAPDMTTVVSHTPPALARLVAQCLARSPADRPTAVALAASLEKLRGGVAPVTGTVQTKVLRAPSPGVPRSGQPVASPCSTRRPSLALGLSLGPRTGLAVCVLIATLGFIGLVISRTQPVQLPIPARSVPSTPTDILVLPVRDADSLGLSGQASELADELLELRGGGDRALRAVLRLKKVSRLPMGSRVDDWIQWLELEAWLSRWGTGIPPKSARSFAGPFDWKLRETVPDDHERDPLSERLVRAIAHSGTWPDDSVGWLVLGSLLDEDRRPRRAESAYRRGLSLVTHKSVQEGGHRVWKPLARALLRLRRDRFSQEWWRLCQPGWARLEAESLTEVVSREDPLVYEQTIAAGLSHPTLGAIAGKIQLIDRLRRGDPYLEVMSSARTVLATAPPGEPIKLLGHHMVIEEMCRGRLDSALDVARRADLGVVTSRVLGAFRPGPYTALCDVLADEKARVSLRHWAALHELAWATKLAGGLPGAIHIDTMSNLILGDAPPHRLTLAAVAAKVPLPWLRPVARELLLHKKSWSTWRQASVVLTEPVGRPLLDEVLGSKDVESPTSDAIDILTAQLEMREGHLEAALDRVGRLRRKSIASGRMVALSLELGLRCLVSGDEAVGARLPEFTELSADVLWTAVLARRYSAAQSEAARRFLRRPDEPLNVIAPLFVAKLQAPDDVPRTLVEQARVSSLAQGFGIWVHREIDRLGFR